MRRRTALHEDDPKEECKKMFSLRRRSQDSPPMSTRNRGNHRGPTPLTSTPPLSRDHQRHPRCGMCEEGNLEATMLQCPLSRSKLQELCDHLTHRTSDIYTRGRNNMTPLHLAVLKGDEPATRVLLAFGADINSSNDFDQTPLDIATQNQVDTLVPLLVSCGCEAGTTLSRSRSARMRRLSPLPSVECISASSTSSRSVYLATPGYRKLSAAYHRLEVESTDQPTMSFTRKTTEMLTQQLTQEIDHKLELSTTLDGDEAIQLVMQQKEVNRLRKCSASAAASVSPWTVPLQPAMAAVGGCRVLSLDGGGIRGLIQIEVLCELERVTGKRVTQLFDTIIGTSTGGIIALGLVYCKKSLTQLRQLYFKLKDQVFGRGRMGYAYNTAAMEDILKEELGTEKTMMDVTYPRVLVTAVDKSAVQPKLCFFNNCFNDQFSTQPIWKVARYTSAAPLYFTESDNFVDGGLLANNPCDTGLTRLRRFHQERGERMAVSCVVSIGSGVSPSEILGCVGPSLNLRSILNIGDNIRRTTNLIKLLSHALGESEEVARKCRSDCRSQSIPYFRFSPQLNETIEPSETDTGKLVEMLVHTKIDTFQDPQMNQLPKLLLSLLPQDDYDD